MNVENAQLAKKKANMVSSKGLSENVSELQYTRNMVGNNISLLTLILDKMTIDFDMFNPYMKDSISSNFNCNFVITSKLHWLSMNDTERSKKATKPE